jgi:hypothetical protein
MPQQTRLLNWRRKAEMVLEFYRKEFSTLGWTVQVESEKGKAGRSN